MDSLDWKSEAEAVIADIASCVSTAALSSTLSKSPRDIIDNRVAYINIETKEGEKITVRLDPQGFSVVGRGSFDDKSLENRANQKYETVYALLNNLSPSYTLTFAQNLTEKLSRLQNGSSGSGGNKSGGGGSGVDGSSAQQNGK